LLLYSIAEAWSWERDEEQLRERRSLPSDVAARRPSHADMRKALQRDIRRDEIQAALGKRAERREFRALADRPSI
jgi:hypothetical protein